MAGLYEGGDPRFLDAKRAKLMIEEAERISFWRGLLMGGLFTVLLMLLSVGLADAAEVSSVRASDHEWFCETEAGVEISGHTRQDKAFQSCMNMALQDGATYIVRGGTYRVTASGAATPPTEPPPTEPPPVEPPVEPPPDVLPLVTFGPVSAITQYPNSISALARGSARWEITFTLNTTTGVQGLASRDENGTRTPGHLGIWIDNGVLKVRHQDLDQSIQIDAVTPILVGVTYVASVSIESGAGFSLWLDGEFQASDPMSPGLAGNDLPLTLGGLCSRCNDPVDPTIGPDRPIDGEVSMAIYADPLPMPNGSVMLNWTNPTEDVDGAPLPTGVPDRIGIYRVEPRGLVAHLDGESIAHEVTGLSPGEHCFVATAFNGAVESLDSNISCKPVP